MSSQHIERFNSGRVLPLSLPFSEGTAVGGIVFLSGQLGNVPGTLTLVEGGIEAEARQALANILTVLQAQGMDLGNLVRCTVMLADIAEWPDFTQSTASSSPRSSPSAISAARSSSTSSTR